MIYNLFAHGSKFDQFLDAAPFVNAVGAVLATIEAGAAGHAVGDHHGGGGAGTYFNGFHDNARGLGSGTHHVDRGGVHAVGDVVVLAAKGFALDLHLRKCGAGVLQSAVEVFGVACAVLLVEVAHAETQADVLLIGELVNGVAVDVAPLAFGV